MSAIRYRRTIVATQRPEIRRNHEARPPLGPVTVMNSRRVTEIMVAAAATEPAAPSLLAGVCQVAAMRLRGIAVTVAYVGQAAPMDAAAVSSAAGAALDVVQLDLGDGPNEMAARTGHQVDAVDLSRDRDTWPMFANAALTSGVEAVFVFPIGPTGAIVALMTLYRGFTGALNDAESAEVVALTEAATQVVLHHEHVEPGSAYHHQPTSARWVQVQQASGMVSVQLGISPPDALATLRAHAYATAQPVVVVARAVVERQLRFDPSDDNWSQPITNNDATNNDEE